MFFKRSPFCAHFRPPSQHAEVNRRRRHTNILLGCITAVFFICWGPLIFYTILYEFLPEILPQQTVMASVGYTLSLLFGMLTPIANPMFYGLLNDPFREVMKDKFPWLFCTGSNTVIRNLTIQSLALSLPAIPKWKRHRVTLDESKQNFQIEQSPQSESIEPTFCNERTILKSDAFKDENCFVAIRTEDLILHRRKSDLIDYLQETTV